MGEITEAWDDDSLPSRPSRSEPPWTWDPGIWFFVKAPVMILINRYIVINYLLLRTYLLA